MAQKKITDLQLISNVTDDLNIPGDNGIQSYRATALQFKNYILADGNVTTSKIADGNVTLAKLASAVAQSLVPVGTVLPFVGDTAPAGYLMCEGAEVSRSTYAALYAVVGNRHGSGDGSTTFRLPDYKGLFLRGRANGNSNDPDRASRTAMNTGGVTGDSVGSIQSDAFQGHRHRVETGGADSGSNNTYVIGARRSTTPSVNTIEYATDISSHVNGTPRTSNETRPKNAYVNYIIKF